MEQTIESSVQCQGVHSSKVSALWSRVAPLVEKGLGDSISEISPDNIRQSLEMGEMQLWVGIDMEVESIEVVMVTEIIEFPLMKVCHIVANGGSRLREWESFMETIKAWAQEQGCSKIKAFARDGWIKVLQKYGYEKKSNVIEVDLEGV